MTMIYRVIDGFDPNVVPGANFVQSIRGGIGSISYKAAPGIGKTQTLTVAYQDSSGQWLVGAESDVMATLPAPQYTLDSLVAPDRSAWETWRYQCEEDEDGNTQRGRGRDVKLGEIPPGLWVAFNASGGRLPLEQLPFFALTEDVTNMKPCPEYSCGPFRSEDTASVWFGDSTIQPLSMIAVQIDDIKEVR